MNTLVIQTAQPVDFNPIAKLLNLAFQEDRAYIADPLETESSIKAAIDCGGTYLVAVDSGVLIGCVYLDPSVMAIFKLAVEPSWRRHGYGRRLVRKAERYAKAAAWPKVLVGFLKPRSHLLKYYENLGYIYTGENPIHPRHNIVRHCPMVIMSKELC